MLQQGFAERNEVSEKGPLIVILWDFLLGGKRGEERRRKRMQVKAYNGSHSRVRELKRRKEEQKVVKPTP